jgi:hypothetical protein
VFELTVEASGDVALEAAADPAVGFAFGAATFDVVAGSLVMHGSGEGDDVQGAVELPVAGSVEPVPADVRARTTAFP